MFDIENCPAEAWNYEFIVCEVRDDKLIFNSYHKSGCAADTVASHLNCGVVVHNVRINGYQDPAPMKRFTFSGKWYWECFAHNIEEAKQKYYDESYPDDIYIANYDDVSVEDCKS